VALNTITLTVRVIVLMPLSTIYHNGVRVIVFMPLSTIYHNGVRVIVFNATFNNI
jgi:hypothetical protein